MTPQADVGHVRLGPDSLVATDFDGTMSPIVANPDAARPADGAVDALVALSGKVGELAVISGRPLSFLTRFFPAEVSTVGLYGLEMLRRGERVEHPQAGVWRETMSDVASGAQLHGPPDMRVELKELSITLHYREHPELADAVEAYAAEAAEAAGLRLRSARMSVELHPPIDEDKGTALERLAADHSGAVVFLGDDVGDLPAFDALDRLESQGRSVLRVAVRTEEFADEMPEQLGRRADVVVDGTDGALALLQSLVEGPGR